VLAVIFLPLFKHKIVMKAFIDIILHDNKKIAISKRYIVLIVPLENGETRITVDFPNSIKDLKHFLQMNHIQIL
jgi:hypothetical protein